MGRHARADQREDKREPSDHKVHSVSSRDVRLDVNTLPVEVLDVLLVHDADKHADRVSGALAPFASAAQDLKVRFKQQPCLRV